MSKLETVFAKVLRLPETMSVQDVRQEETSAWDSVRHVQLVSAIEEAFGIRLTSREIFSMRSFADARTILQKRGLE